MDRTAHDTTVETWVAAFGAALDRHDIDGVLDLFEPDGFWRDLAALTWNVYTAEGGDAIRAMLSACLEGIAPTAWNIDQLLGSNNGVHQALLSFETRTARCSAVLRLRGGRCWTLLTAVSELIGFEETTRARRTNGAPLRYEPGRPDWRTERDRRTAELGVTQQPYCVIVGAGQAGLGLGARLKQLGVPTLIVDKRERPSDTWRERYATLSLHSPVWYDHMPYLPFPETWPRFASKDRVADWLDAYATIMDLDIWTGADCIGSQYDEALGAWRLSIIRGGRPIELRPMQLVLATGFWDAPYVPDIPGRDRFAGRQQHVADARDIERCDGLRSIVIGAGTSAHDIAAQLWEAGANVTMIQRSPTIVTRIDSLLPAVEIYDTDAPAPKPPTELADLLAASIPNRLMPQFQAPFIAAIKAKDAAFYEGLRKAGFLYDFGEDGGGFITRGMQDPSGFYIGRLGTHHQWPRRRAKRRLGRRDPRTERGSERRGRTAGRLHRLCYGIPKAGPGWGDPFERDHPETRTHRRHWLRLPTRRWAMGWRDPERMEADAAAGPLVPQWQFWADAILLAHTGIADQGPPCRSADADLRPTLILGAFGGKPPTATASILP
jgi:putative flavoprotein involved in K+ transport